MRPEIDFQTARKRAEQGPCGYCGAHPGERCVYEDRSPLIRQAAHLSRLKAAGVAAAPRLSAAVL